jgi:subtilisin-like proprotein convertase family protein
LAGGAIALMLQQRPDLTWRDVQGVLIESAMMISEYDEDWQTNGAGYSINHNFGFGRIDSANIMDIVEDWELLPAEISVSDVNQASMVIPDYGASGEQRAESVIQVEEDFDVESVEVSVKISHRRRGHLGITLVSPSGTESKLFTPHLDNTSNIDWTFTTMRCWGEPSKGVWTLVVYDNERGARGELSSWILSIHGHQRSVTGGK